MNDLISITQRTIGSDDVQTVNARDLHVFLEVKDHFANWVKSRIESYGFTDGSDFVKFTASEFAEAGNRGAKIEYAITIDMAKELAMVERNAKGKEARQYFIECERRAKQPVFNLPKNYKEALVEILAQIESREKVEAELAAAQPAISFTEAVSTKDGIETFIRVAAKTLIGGVGATKQMVEWMVDHKWLTKASGDREATAYACNIGYMRQRVDVVNGKPYGVAVITGKGMAALFQAFDSRRLMRAV